MPQRIAIFAASLATALVVAAGLAIAGFGPSAAPVAAPVAADGVPVDAAAAATPIVQVDTIYVAPQPTPQEIVVKQASVTRGDEGEQEGEDD